MIIGNPIVIGGGGSSDGVAEGLFHAVYNAAEIESPLEDSELHPVTEVPAETFMSGSMSEVYFSSCVTIGRSAFAECRSLRRVSFPSCVTVGDYAFYNAEMLYEVGFENLQYVGSDAFARTGLSSFGDVFSKLKVVGDRAFASCAQDNCESLWMEMPDLESVGQSAFDGLAEMCITLDLGKATSVNNAFGIDSSSTYAFSRLESLSMSCVSSVPPYMFNGAQRLTVADIRACTEVGSSAFYGCARLSSVSAPSLATIGACAFENCFNLVDFAQFSMVESVGAGAFSIDPSEAATISSASSGGAFSEAVLNMPRLAHVGSWAFQGRQLAVVSLPSLQELGSGAFSECTIGTLYLMGSSVPTFGESVFLNATGPDTVYVPSSLYDAYMLTSLSGFNVVGV
jgi:hypothetical protein